MRTPHGPNHAGDVASPAPSPSPQLALVRIAPHVETMRVERPRAKTSSERGKAFRARRKAQQAALSAHNATLTRQIRTLVAERHAVHEVQFLRAAHTPAGSLERLVREYYAVFDHGYRDCTCSGSAGRPPCGCTRPVAKRALRQNAFVMQAVDEDARIGHARGRAALIEQWRVYTAAHRKYQGEIQRVEFLGTEDAPLIVVHSHVITGISRLTLETMFPHVLVDAALVKRLDGLDVVYDCAARFAFTADGALRAPTLISTLSADCSAWAWRSQTSHGCWASHRWTARDSCDDVRPLCAHLLVVSCMVVADSRGSRSIYWCGKLKHDACFGRVLLNAGGHRSQKWPTRVSALGVLET